MNSNSQYSIASFSPTALRGRVVAAGLRIRYVGTELQKGGDHTGLTEPNHAPLVNMTIANFNQYMEAGKLSPDGAKWSSITYRPVDDSDDDFIGAAAGISPAYGSQNSYFMGFVVQCPDGSGANPSLYAYEAYVQCEYIGSVVRTKTPSTVDLAGHSAVNSAAAFSPHVNKASQLPAAVKAKHLHAEASKAHAQMSGTGVVDLATKAVSALPSASELGDDLAIGIESIGNLLGF